MFAAGWLCESGHAVEREARSHMHWIDWLIVLVPLFIVIWIGYKT